MILLTIAIRTSAPLVCVTLSTISAFFDFLYHTSEGYKFLFSILDSGDGNTFSPAPLNRTLFLLTNGRQKQRQSY